MNELHCINKPLKHQTGGALLVAMIMIFMLSIMGVSSMKGSTLERRMASNSIQTATTFQGAESTSELALNDNSNLTEAINQSDFSKVNQGELEDSAILKIPVNLLQDIGLEAEAELQYVGFGPAYGFSSSFVAYRFKVVGKAKIDSIRSNAQITQGAYRIAPGP